MAYGAFDETVCTAPLGPTIHKKVQHEGLRYPCDTCEFKAKSKPSLKLHINAIHKGLRISCKHCEKTVTAPGNLSNHIKISHGEEKKLTQCNLCDYSTFSQKYHRRHMLKHQRANGTPLT